MKQSSPHEEGDPNSELLILAEAPGGAEMRFQKPLVGPSGNIFNDCLHAAGIARRQCYILNTWPFQIVKPRDMENFYPAGHMNDPSCLLWTKKGFTEFGLKQAQPTIEKIKASSANCILAMGKPAMSLCTGDVRPIMKWRGSIVWSSRFNKKTVITVHPAATLHGTYVWRYLIISDMEKFRDEHSFDDLIPPRRNLITGPSFTDAMEYLKYCQSAEHVATDLEVINHQVSCFSLCVSPDEAMSVPVGDEFGHPIWDEAQEMALWHRYAELMGNPNITKINQNLIGFDAPFLIQQNNIYTRGPLYDTMIGQKILYPDFNKGLDFICSIHTKEPYYKDEGKMWRGMGGDIEMFWRYNARDAAVALEAWGVIQKELREKDQWDTYTRRAGIAEALWYMTVRGFKVNRDKLNETHREVEAKLNAKIQELNEVAKVPFNAQSPKQCQSYFYGLLGIAPYRGKTGITTDDKAMSRIYRKHNLPEAKLVQEIRALRKLKSTYLEVTFDADGRLRCSWDPTGTWTGRLSSRETVFGTGMNQQNLHPEFKQFLVADDDA